MKIVGYTVCTSLPKPDFNQTDPKKGDYIKNKPDIDGLQTTIDSVSDLVGDKKVSEQIGTAIGELATVSTTGSFNDLLDKPESITNEEIDAICGMNIISSDDDFIDETTGIAYRLYVSNGKLMMEQAMSLDYATLDSAVL